jgi:hypothetical protein
MAPATRDGLRSSPVRTRTLPSTRAAAVGMTASDTTRLSVTAATIASAMSRNSCPASSSTSRIGRNTTTVVSVAARTAPNTSRAPSSAACSGDLPSSRCRNTFSSTTIALSTTIPTAKAMPARLMTFTLRPMATMNTTAPITEIGIDSAMIPALRNDRRKRSNTSTAREPPIQMLLRTSASASSM